MGSYSNLLAFSCIFYWIQIEAKADWIVIEFIEILSESMGNSIKHIAESTGNLIKHLPEATGNPSQILSKSLGKCSRWASRTLDRQDISRHVRQASDMWTSPERLQVLRMALRQRRSREYRTYCSRWASLALDRQENSRQARQAPDRWTSPRRLYVFKKWRCDSGEVGSTARIALDEQV